MATSIEKEFINVCGINTQINVKVKYMIGKIYNMTHVFEVIKGNTY